MFNNPEPKKQIEKAPEFVYAICDTIRLSVPTVFPSTSFWKIIRDRKSSKEFKQLSIEQISNILYLASKTKDVTVDSDGYVLTHRPSASAGARHPIDILVISPILGKNVLHYYNPFEHTINKLDLNSENIDQFLLHVNGSINLNNATVIWFLAHPSRTSTKYDNAVSLIWRDAGALIHSIQLACTFYDISSCPLGTLGEPYISDIFSNFGMVWSAGGIVIG